MSASNFQMMSTSDYGKSRSGFPVSKHTPEESMRVCLQMMQIEFLDAALTSPKESEGTVEVVF